MHEGLRARGDGGERNVMSAVSWPIYYYCFHPSHGTARHDTALFCCVVFAAAVAIDRLRTFHRTHSHTHTHTRSTPSVVGVGVDRQSEIGDKRAALPNPARSSATFNFQTPINK